MLGDFFTPGKEQPDSHALTCGTEEESASRSEGPWLSGIGETGVTTGMVTKGQMLTSIILMGWGRIVG